MRCFPWQQGVKKSADIGRNSSKPVKHTVSGKNYHSTERVTLKKSKLEYQPAPIGNMNHIRFQTVHLMKEDGMEDMDTQEGQLNCIKQS